jgi:hypothetical protein
MAGRHQQTSSTSELGGAIDVGGAVQRASMSDGSVFYSPIELAV